MLAVGLGLLQSAGQRLDLWSMLLAAIGLVCLLMPLRRVLPGQSLRIGPGLPTVVALRGLFSFAFFGAEAYVPLTLTRIHHGSPTNVGIPLTLGAIGWAAAAWWQGRPGNAEHPLRLLRGGYVLVGAGVAGLVAVTWSSVSMWFAAPLWAVSGAGMGLAYPTISVLLLRLSPIDEQGANSAALQVCDVVGSIVGVAVTATIVALAGAGEFATAMRVADPLLAALTVAGLLLARRATHGAAIAR
jgi:predicted MFS family arabinose efflux permease